MPTPEQCRTGNYNNFYDGGSPGRFAVCVADDGRIVSYVGGDVATLCGLSIVNDVVVAQDEYGRDPNHCPKAALPASDATNTSNIKHRSNVPPHHETATAGHSQTDLAFWGNLAFAGNYGGVRVIDISSPSNPRVVADLECYGPQSDVSVWQDLLVVSVDRPLTSPHCGSREARVSQQDDAFEGLRLFRVSDILNATPGADGRVHVDPVATVPVDCGSHTNTLVPEPDKGRVLVYVSSTGYNPGPRCGPENSLRYGYDPLHRKISIVEVKLSAPQEARIISEPKLDAPVFRLEPEEGSHIAPSTFRPSISCHDITVFLEIKLAAAACVSEGQLWDISDPVNPKTVAHIDNRHVEFWHSAAFSWDGKTVVFSDEPQGSHNLAGCNSKSMKGRLWFYSVSDPTEPLGSFQLPRSEGSQPCYAHQLNVMPVAGRNVGVVAAYGGGVSVVDFTYPHNAHEIAFYDFDEPDAPRSDTWSAYWYNGFIYANDGLQWGSSTGDSGAARGVDIYQLTDPSRDGAKTFRYLNPQTQEKLIKHQ